MTTMRMAIKSVMDLSTMKSSPSAISKMLINTKSALNIPERPYWDNFFMEELFDGKVDSALACGLNRYDPELKARAKQGSIEFDGQDSGDLHTNVIRGNIIASKKDDKED